MVHGWPSGLTALTTTSSMLTGGYCSVIARIKWVAVIASMASIWAQGASPDRVVAEWMLRMGGSVVLVGQSNPISDLVDLPTTEFHIHTLNFTGITQWGFALEEEMKR